MLLTERKYNLTKVPPTKTIAIVDNDREIEPP